MTTSEPPYTQLKTNDLPWYLEEIGDQLTPDIRQVLETYAKIPPDQVESHILAVRKKLWDIRAYPCTGLFAFLVAMIKYHSQFDEVVSILKSSPDKKIVDVGCYICHDLRALHWEGVPLTSLYGLDIIDYSGPGWELFNDADRFTVKDRLLHGDIIDLSDDSPATKIIDGKMDVVWCGSVLHQFSWNTALQACKRLIRYSKGDGSLIIGVQVGNTKEEGGTVEKLKVSKSITDDQLPFQHTASSLERLWRQAAEELGIKLDVKVVWHTWEHFGCEPERCKMLGPDLGLMDMTVKLGGKV